MGRESLGFFLALEAERRARPVFFFTISRSARGSRMSLTEPMPVSESLVGETVCDRGVFVGPQERLIFFVIVIHIKRQPVRGVPTDIGAGR